MEVMKGKHVYHVTRPSPSPYPLLTTPYSALTNMLIPICAAVTEAGKARCPMSKNDTEKFGAWPSVEVSKADGIQDACLPASPVRRELPTSSLTGRPRVRHDRHETSRTSDEEWGG